jgi:hypothetical protein
VGAFKNFDDLFRPEGLMARLETGASGEVFYDVPFGITTHDVKGPSYVCAQNFALLQQKGQGIVLAARTGAQAIAVDADSGSLGLALGASTPSGPVRNPYMVVDGLNIEHESPWYAEPFVGSHVHEFVILPYSGQWSDEEVPAKVRSMLNPAFVFEVSESGSSKSEMPAGGSFLELDPSNVEFTHLEATASGIEVRLNERCGRESSGMIQVGDYRTSFDTQPQGIVEVILR